MAGGAPAVLRARIETSSGGADDGYVAELRDGPELIFGAATRLRAKWAAAARVLADLEARGATYVDLRIPSRPAVGGLAATTVTPVAPAGTPSSPRRRRRPPAPSRPKARNSCPEHRAHRYAANPPTTAVGGYHRAVRFGDPRRRLWTPLTAGAGGGATATP